MAVVSIGSNTIEAANFAYRVISAYKLRNGFFPLSARMKNKLFVISTPAFDERRQFMPLYLFMNYDF